MHDSLHFTNVFMRFVYLLHCPVDYSVYLYARVQEVPIAACEIVLIG